MSSAGSQHSSPLKSTDKPSNKRGEVIKRKSLEENLNDLETVRSSSESKNTSDKNKGTKKVELNLKEEKIAMSCTDSDKRSNRTSYSNLSSKSDELNLLEKK